MPSTSFSGTLSMGAPRERIEAAVRALNDLLVGKHLLVVQYDTASMPHGLMKPGYTQLSMPGEVQINTMLGHEYISVPLGITVEIPFLPTMFEGKVHRPHLEIFGDHVVISIPYFFYEDHHRVDQMLYSITVLRD